MVTPAQKVKRKENRRTALEVLAVLLLIAGVMWGSVQYFASAEELTLVDMRLEGKIVGDSIYNLYNQKSQLEVKWGNDVCSSWVGNGAHVDRERYLRIQTQLKQLELKQEYIIQEQTKGKQ